MAETNDGRWLRRVSGAMAIFCGFAAAVLTLAVAASLIGGAIAEWRGRPAAYAIGGNAAHVTGKFSGVRLESCASDKAKLCPADHPPEMKGYMSGQLAAITLQAPLAALAYGLFEACACFVGLSRGRALARRTVDRLMRFSLAGLAFVLLSPCAGLVAGWVFEGSRRLMDAVTNDNKLLFSVSHYTANYTGVSGLLTVIYAVTLTVIAVVMAKASTIADDHAQIV